jgi:hypothetical protein
MIAGILRFLFDVSCGALFIYVTALLLYQRLFSRWLGFGFGFVVAYTLSVWWMFGQLPGPVQSFVASPGTAPMVSLLVFLVGPTVCVGYCLVCQLSWMQTAGVLACYMALAIGLLLLAGWIPMATFVAYVALLPYVLFFVGTPLVLGWAMFRGMACGSIAGLLFGWFFALVLVSIVITNYFGIPFGLFYTLGEHTKAWIGLGVLAAGLMGIPSIVGYGWMHDWGRKAIAGALVLFLTGMSTAVLLVQLTVGWQALFPGGNP